MKKLVLLLICLAVLIVGVACSETAPPTETNAPGSESTNISTKVPDNNATETPNNNNENQTSDSNSEHVHSFSMLEITKAPSCTTAGTLVQTCSLCNFSITTTIAELDHSEVVDKAVPATCTTEGKTAGKHCNVCNTITAPQITIPSLGHTYSKNAPAGSVCGVCENIKYSSGLAYEEITYKSCSITGIGNCTDKEVYVPEYIDGYKVTSIGVRAFENCTNLTGIIIPGSIEYIGRSSFSGCTNLKNITISYGVKSINSNAFFGCTSLTRITLPYGITTIGESAFSNCTSLLSIDIPASVTSIENSAFYDCSSLTSITLPIKITRINMWLFCGCTSLTNVTIPQEVTSIGYSAFNGCANLTSVTIPKSVLWIDPYAFAACTSLASIHFSGTKQEWGFIRTSSSWNLDTGKYTIYCTDEEIIK